MTTITTNGHAIMHGRCNKNCYQLLLTITQLLNGNFAGLC